MRKTLAIVAILCGAVSAYAAEPQKWCVKYTEGGVSLIKAPGITFNLKHVGRYEADTEESEVWSTEDGRFSIAFAENDVYWHNGAAGETIPDCD